MKTIVIALSMLVVWSCSVQKTLNPEHYDYIRAKNELTTDYAIISTIEHTTIHRLRLNQIPVERAKTIDQTIKEINFKLDLSKKLLEAGNYEQSYIISHDEHKKLTILLKSLKGQLK